MADSPEYNVVNSRRHGRGRGRGHAKARGQERLSHGTQLATVPSESQPQGHGRNIQCLATESTAVEARPGQASRVVTVEDDNDKLTVADMATPEQGKERQLHGKSTLN